MFGTRGTHNTHPEVTRIEKNEGGNFRAFMQTQKRPCAHSPRVARFSGTERRPWSALAPTGFYRSI